MRRRLLPYLPVALMALIAVTQFAVAKTTPLSAWKLGGFGMFSTTNTSVYRVLQVTVETDEGRFVVPNPTRQRETLQWPRASVLRGLAREAACARWRSVPLDSVDAVAFPSPDWAPFYQTPDAREKTDLDGFAVAADPVAGAPTLALRSARASVYRIRFDTAGGDPTLRPDVVASETVTPGEACPSTR